MWGGVTDWFGGLGAWGAVESLCGGLETSAPVGAVVVGASRLPLGGAGWSCVLGIGLGFGLVVCELGVLWSRSAEAWRPPLRWGG